MTVRWFSDDAQYHVKAIEIWSSSAIELAPHLSRFPRLQNVRIPYASDAEFDHLQSLLPSCVVERTGSDGDSQLEGSHGRGDAAWPGI